MKDFDWKSLTQKQLEWAFEGVEFKLKPRWHQLVSLAFAACDNRVAFWHDVGTGKTLTAYWAAQQWGCQKILVVCPGSALGAWPRDAKWTDYTCKVISGSTPQRRRLIHQDQNVSVVQYECLKTVFAELKEQKGMAPFKRGLSEDEANKYRRKDPDKYKVIPDQAVKGGWCVFKKKPRKWQMDEQSLLQYDCIIFDEVHRCSDYRSLQSEICISLSKLASNVVALSGTPVDRCLLELFNIYNVVDLGATFGESFFGFRNSYFQKFGYDWEVKEGCKPALMKRWAIRSLSFAREECFDLPLCQQEVVKVEPSKEVTDLSRRIVTKEPIGVMGSQAVFNQISTMVAKCKQLTGGFIYLKEGGERKAYRLKHNFKLEALMDILDAGDKTIVFHEFQECGDMIEEALVKKNIGFGRLKGGLTPQERFDLEDRFQNNPDCQVMIVQTSAGSEGWDGFAATVTVFYDIVSSPRVRKQCIGRMVRSGQTNKTLVIELILKRSVNVITKMSQEGRINEIDGMMEYIRNYEVRHEEKRNESSDDE